MIDMDLLKKRGVTHANLKKWFEKDVAAWPKSGGRPTTADVQSGSDEAKRANLIDRIRMRIQEGRQYNLDNYKVWAAIKFAWDTPFNQINPTLVRDLMNSDPDDPKVEDMLNSFSIRDVLEVKQDPKSGEKTIRNFNAPVFWNVLVPLARSILTIRWSKIVNDHDREPFFGIQPAISTKLNRLRCEILERRIEQMSQDYDYFNNFKQSTLYMLKYGISVEVPKEEWHYEMQETEDESDARLDSDGEIIYTEDDTDESEDLDSEPEPGRMTRLVREGMRFYHPDPSRFFIDKAHNPTSLNTDTGCAYLGYWKIVRYRDIRDNPRYWNKEAVTVGGANTYWWNEGTAFLNAVYGHCTISFPNFNDNDSNDRESKQVYNLYTQQYEDNAVQMTEYFEKLIPKDNGLGDYEYPVWFRFVVASDDTILYAAPLPYCPATYAGYDSDEYQDQNSSLMLEAMPFQDLFTNTLTQHFLSLKQNTLNLSFIDKEAVDESWIEKLKMMGDKLFSKVNLIPFSSKLWSRKQLKPENVVQNFKFPQLNTQESIQALKLILDILERVLVMSSQEVAQAASHEQTREEIRNIAHTTSNRLQFTAQPLDKMLDAKKKQLYLGLMAYGEDEMWAQIPSERYVTPELLAQLGYTTEDTQERLDMAQLSSPENQDEMMIRIEKRRLAVPFSSFARQKDDHRFQSSENGAAMMQFITGVAGNPQVLQAVGIEQVINMTNEALKMIGFPPDFRLKFTGQEQGDMIAEQLQQFAQEINARLGPLEQGVEKNGQALIELAKEHEALFNPDGASDVQ